MADIALPPGVVTENFPVAAPAGTIAVICVALFTLKVADVPLSENPVAPVKFVPVTMTEFPTCPLLGLKPVMVGAGTGTDTVKLLVEVALPCGVTTEIFPVVAPLGTVAIICVALLTVIEGEATPLKETAVAPYRLVPLTVTEAPTAPLMG